MKPSKRICVFSDGTWKSPDDETPTNILRLAKATLRSSGGIPQLVFYDPGVGTNSGKLSRLLGAFGQGLSANIIELYTLISQNYAPGDEICLFGYSRGAYTVRSLAGLIHKSGLTRRNELEWIREAYALYRQDVDAESTKARRFRRAHGDRVPIKCMVCFDTVGALGVPDTLPWPLSYFGDDYKYRFHDTTLSKGIEHGIHALSIDEERAAYLPTRMKGVRQGQVTEKFLPGRHSGVGGGSKKEHRLADNALWFAVDEMRRRGVEIGLDHKMLPKRGGWDATPTEAGSRARIMKVLAGEKARSIGGADELHESALKRFRYVKEWRPTALHGLEHTIMRRSKPWR